MKDFSFHQGSPQTGAAYLFNHPGHLQLQASTGWKAFYATRNSTGERVALVHFHVRDNIARSPFRAPYGPFEFTLIEPEFLNLFVAYIVEELKRSGVTRIIIKDTPAIFRYEHASVLQVVLLKHGFAVSGSELGASIVVNSEPLANRMAEWELRKLKQAGSAELKFSPVPLSQLPEVYTFIAACRAHKGYEISMTMEEVMATADKFPSAFQLFTVHHKERIAAACISLSVSADVLYTFYFDHHRDFDNLSPVALLIDGIYDVARQNNFRLVDLGVSGKDGVLNFGLLQFKMRLGATTSSCLTFEKNVEQPI